MNLCIAYGFYESQAVISLRIPPASFMVFDRKDDIVYRTCVQLQVAEYLHWLYGEYLEILSE